MEPAGSGGPAGIERARQCRICHSVRVGLLVAGEFMPFSKHTLSTHCVHLCTHQEALEGLSGEESRASEGPAGAVTFVCWL